MATASIPGLPVAITLDGTEQLEIVQPAGSGGTTKRATTGQIANIAGLYNYILTPQSVFGNPTSTATAGTSIVGSASTVFQYDSAGQIGFRKIDMSSAIVTGILPVIYGGSGTAGLVGYGVVIGNDTAAFSAVASVTAGYVLTSAGTAAYPVYQLHTSVAQQPGLSVLGVTGNATAYVGPIVGVTDQVLRVDANGTALTFGQVNLSATSAITGSLNVSAYVTGIIAVSHGGSGTSALTAYGVVFGNGTSPVTVSNAFDAGQLLVGQTTTSNPLPLNVTGDLILNALGTATVVTNAITYPKIQTFQALTVLGNTSSAVANSTAIAGTTDQVLRVAPNGTSLGFGQVNLSSTSAITGSLNVSSYATGVMAVANGGSGTSALTANSVLIGNGTGAVGLVSVAGTVNGFVLSSSGTSTPPTFSKVNLSSTVVTGFLIVPFGGLGTTTLTSGGILYGNGTAAVGATSAGSADQVFVMNSGGTGFGFGQVNLSTTAAVTGALNVSSLVTGVLKVINGGTGASVAATAIVNLGGLALATTGQAFSGGVVLTTLNLGTATNSTVTFVAGNPAQQRLVLNGTATFVAPSSDCEFAVLVTNGVSASTISYSGYSVGVNTGDSLTTTSGNKYIFLSMTINGSSTYSWKALQ